MAHWLLDAGNPLTVYNRTPEKTQPPAARGATVTRCPRELAILGRQRFYYEYD